MSLKIETFVSAREETKSCDFKIKKSLIKLCSLILTFSVQSGYAEPKPLGLNSRERFTTFLKEYPIQFAC